MIQVGDKILVRDGSGFWKGVVTAVAKNWKVFDWTARGYAYLRAEVGGTLHADQEGEVWMRGWDTEARDVLKFMGATR